MDRKPFLINIRFNNIYYIKTFINSGYLYYTFISENLYRKLNLLYIVIIPRRLDKVIGVIKKMIKWITYTDINLDNHR